MPQILAKEFNNHFADASPTIANGYAGFDVVIEERKCGGHWFCLLGFV